MEQPTKKPQVVSNPEKQSRVSPSKAGKQIKITASAELLKLHSQNCSVPLAVVPCRNGILEKDSIVNFYDETYRIERLFFDGEQKPATANLRGTDDDLVFILLTASRISLLDEHYHMTKALPNTKDCHQIDRAFVIFSAIRRAIGMAKRRKK